jgi:hypothetical protein
MGARATPAWLDGQDCTVGREHLACASPADQLPFLARRMPPRRRAA